MLTSRLKQREAQLCPPPQLKHKVRTALATSQSMTPQPVSHKHGSAFHLCWSQITLRRRAGTRARELQCRSGR